MHNTRYPFPAGNGCNIQSFFEVLFAGGTTSSLRNCFRQCGATVLALLLLIAGYPLAAQSVDWLNTTSAQLVGNAITVDAPGNTFTTGYFSGTLALTNGPNALTLSTGQASGAIFITKTDATGNLVWAKTFASTNLSSGDAIRVDPAGNLFLTGIFRGSLVLGSGPASTTLTSTGSASGYVAKLNGNGELIWANLITGTSLALPGRIALAPSGEVFVTGNFVGTISFSPALTSTSLTAAGRDIFIARINAAGVMEWAYVLGPGFGNALETDASGAVYLGGSISTSIDLDPGPGSLTLTGGGFAAKFNADASPVWAYHLKAGRATTTALATDASHNVYVTGLISGSVTNGTGPGATTLTTAGLQDLFLLKLNDSGNLQWARLIGSDAFAQDKGLAVLVDKAGDVLVAGDYSGTTVVGSGPSATTLIAGNLDTDGLIAKFDNAGNALWARGISSPGSFVNALGMDQTGNIYVKGFTGNTTINWPSAPLSVPTSYFLIKLATISASPTVSNSVVCAGRPLSFSVEATSGTLPYSYTWTAPAGISLPANTNTSAITGTATQQASGLYTLTVTVAGSGSAPAGSSTISVSVNAQPSVTITGNPTAGPFTCANPSLTLTAQTTATALVWSSGGSTSQSLPVSQNGVYSVTATDAGGCQSVTSHTVTADQSLPVVSISAAGSVLTCANPALQLTATTAATTLHWSTGQTTAAISVSTVGVYSVTATGANGCTAVSNSFSVSQDLSLSFTISSATVCVGQRFSLLANGCSGQVIWSTGASGNSLPLTAGSSTSVLTATCTVGSCSATASGSVVIGKGVLLPPDAGILSLSADESGCPVQITGQATGSLFVVTGPGEGGGYVFSNAYRSGGTHPVLAAGITRSGVYKLTATYTTECGTSAPVTRTVTVNRNCP